jgi:hypothetical protein
MKISVDKELVEDALDRMIWVANQGSPRKPGDGSDFDRVITILQSFLDKDTNNENIEDSINRQVPGSAWKFVQGNTPYDITDDDRRWADEAIEKHDDSQILVRSKEANIQAIKEALAKEHDDRKSDDNEIRRLRKLAYEKRPAPDPRCDGCEHQHPYAENLSYDIAAGKVYCNRGTRPPYYKEGRTIKYPDNLMICGVYYLEDDTLIKFFKPKPHIKNTSEAFSKQTVELELSNKYAILDILDMLMEHAKYHIEALGIDSKVFTMPLMFDAENLKNELIGEK